MKQELHIIKEVDVLYRWLEGGLAKLGQSCDACGKCCDFESFGHRLYVTTPELIFFQHFVGSPIMQMTSGVCPYRVEGKCTVYDYRFAGCRIFTCKGDADKENALCEEVLRKFKTLCDDGSVPYHYVSLQAGLKTLNPC